MNIQQIKSIKLLELIESNLKQLKEYAYMKDYEKGVKSQEELEDGLFDIMYGINDYLEIDDRKKEENIKYNLKKEKHYFKQEIDNLKDKICSFKIAEDIYNILNKKLNKEKCYVYCSTMNLNDINNRPYISISVKYPKFPNVLTDCCYIGIMGIENNKFIECVQSSQPMIQALKDYDSYSAKTIAFMN